MHACIYYFSFMNYRIILLFITLAFLSCGENKDQQAGATGPEMAKAEYPDGLEVYDFKGLEPLLNKKDAKTYVVNFWATWCKPCIKELPYFETINQNYKDKNVQVILVSLDFPNQYENKLLPYIEEHGLKSKVVALDDTDMNSWIPKVDENWGGAIPATIIYNNSMRQFYEGSFTYDELVTEVRKFIEN